MLHARGSRKFFRGKVTETQENHTYMMFSCVSVTSPNNGVLGQVRYLILSSLDLCLLPYFGVVSSNHFAGTGLGVGRMQAENQETSPFQADDQVLYIIKQGLGKHRI